MSESVEMRWDGGSGGVVVVWRSWVRERSVGISICFGLWYVFIFEEGFEPFGILRTLVENAKQLHTTDAMGQLCSLTRAPYGTFSTVPSSQTLRSEL